MKPKVVLVAIAIVGLALSVGAAQRPAYAQPLVLQVNTAADGVDALPGDGICATATGECTLRAAIMEANAHPGEGHHINVSGPTITLSLPGAGEDGAATGDLDIRTIVHIVGAVSPPEVVHIDGAGLDRVFHVLPFAYVELENVGVIGGRVSGGEDGGGILNGGKLLMNGCLVQGNSVEDFGRGGGVSNYGYLEIYTSSLDGNAGFLGGGIYNRGMTTIAQSAITENTVQGEGGGIFNYLGIVDASQVTIESNKAVGNYGGGGIYNKDTLDLADSWVLGNSAGWSGGGIANEGTMSLTRTEVSQNTSLGPGGGIYNGGTLTVVGGSIEGNTAVEGAGIDNYTSGGMSLNGVLISGNVADIYGGGVDNAGTAEFAGVTLDGNAAMVGAGIANMGADPGTPALATFSSSDIRSNAATDLGGGIVNYQGRLEVTQSPVESNTALVGAGVLNIDGEANLSDCGIRLNQALSLSSDTLGGGLYSSGSGSISLYRCAISDNASDLGGGVFNDSGIVTLSHSVVNGNTAQAGGGIFNYTDFPIGPSAGASALGPKIRGNRTLEALRGASADPPPGTAWTVVSTSTISGNTSYWYSGGVYNTSQLEVYNSTISANLSAQESEAIYNETGGTVILGNAILVSSGGAVPACAGGGIFQSRGFNLENGSSCGLVTEGDLINTDPLLGPLGDNGGPTVTRALLPGSPAIDAGSNILCGAINGALPTDQRGERRPMDGNNDGGAVCDIGAYEAAGPTSSFGDTAEDHWAFGYIEWLFEDGYVAGCSAEPRLYCPDQGMLRCEAAVFVVHGVRGAGYQPSEPTSSAFVDVPITEPPLWYAKWVQRLWEDGYTGGCWVDEQENRWFCPNTAHTRAEATVFFLHMLLGAQYSPPPPTEQVFDDVPIGQGAPWHSRWVNAAYSQGILDGCEDLANQGDNLFRPDAALTRAEGACMMVNALGLNP